MYPVHQTCLVKGPHYIPVVYIGRQTFSKPHHPMHTPRLRRISQKWISINAHLYIGWAGDVQWGDATPHYNCPYQTSWHLPLKGIGPLWTPQPNWVGRPLSEAPCLTGQQQMKSKAAQLFTLRLPVLSHFHTMTGCMIQRQSNWSWHFAEQVLLLPLRWPGLLDAVNYGSKVLCFACPDVVGVNCMNIPCMTTRVSGWTMPAPDLWICSILRGRRAVATRHTPAFPGFIMTCPNGGVSNTASANWEPFFGWEGVLGNK